MDLRHRFPLLGLSALATLALSLSCSVEGEPSSTGSSAGSPDGSGGASGAGGTTGGTTGGAGTTGNAGVTGTAGTTAAAGTTGAAGTGGMMGTGGAVGGSGGSGAGVAGTPGGTGGDGTGGGAGAIGGAGTGGGGTAGTTGAAGASGSAGSSGTNGPSSGCGTPAGLTSGRASIDVNGKMREYIILVPDNYDPTHPYKLIFGWHPWGGSAQQIASGGYFDLEDVSDGQAILVAPEGQDYERNGQDGLGWGNADGEDIDFLHAMIDRFGAGLCIDQDRIFSTGFSFGAMFSFTLACTEDSRMRAIAPMAGNATTSGRCADGTRSVATMAFIGVEDSLLDGHRDAVQIFVERNGCSTQTVPAMPDWCGELSSNYLPCTCVQYEGCSAGYPVVECEYTADHQFAPSAGETLWNFFSQF